jgi:isopentenyl-diphosphate delta-isomerase
MEQQHVILVNEYDQPVGSMEKMEAHEKGVLHRAFSVFIFNQEGKMLLQQRAAGKYHSAELWTNACCSHPMPGEETLDAVNRRLTEELGISVPVNKVFDFIYKSEFDNGLTEHEFDHVFAGVFDGPVLFNADEVKEVRFSEMETIRESLNTDPGQYTSWFRIAFPKIANWWKERV